MAEQKPLIGPSALLGVAWEKYKLRWKVLLSIQLLSALMIIGGIFLTVMPGAFFLALFKGVDTVTPLVSSVFIIYIILVALFIVLLASWGQLAMVLAVVHDDLKVRESFAQARKLSVWSFVWMSLLNAAIVMGGMVFLIIPGILFAIWTTFTKYIFVQEKKRGLEALLASREYFRDRFWPVFGRIFVIGLLSAMLQGSVSSIPFLGMIVSFAFAPFTALYTYFLYKDLVRLHAEKKSTANTDTSRVFVASGWVAVVLLALMVLLPLLLSLR